MNKIKKIILAILGIGIVGAAGNEALPSDVAMGKVSKAYDVSEPLKAKYNLENSQFAIKGKEDKNATRTVLGEAGKGEFEPSLTISKWEGEASFKIKPDISKVKKSDKGIEINGEKIKYKAGKIDYVFYDIPATPAQGPVQPIDEPLEVGESREISIGNYENAAATNTLDNGDEGGFEFEIVLNQKPASNVFVTPIETQGLEFYPQPPLNEEPQDDGVTCTATECKDADGRVTASRPEDIVDSIAVYSNGKAGDYTAMGGYNYMAGKIAHIKRIKMVAANGASEYCKQAITNVWTITCPQAWLDSAVYPVVVDPTFGYTTAGGSDIQTYSNYTISSLYTTPSDIATVTKITAFVAGDAGTTSIKGVIWLHSDLTKITNGTGGAVSFTETYGDNVWKDSSFSTPPTLTGSTDYLIGIVWNAYGWARYDTGDSNQGHKKFNSYSTPTTLVSPDHTTDKYSIYATYTAGGGETPRRILITE